MRKLSYFEDLPKKITNNLEKKPASTTGLLQFHVPIEIKREFKIMAASQDISQVGPILGCLSSGGDQNERSRQPDSLCFGNKEVS